MKSKAFKLILLLAVLIAITFGISLLFPSRPPVAPKPLPNPNGYDTLTKAAKALPLTSADFTKLNHDELVAVVESSSNALQIARTGLTQQCRVPLQFSQAYIAEHMKDFAGVKKLAQSFAAEGQLAEMENRPADAAQSYLDCARLGIQSSHGGMLIDGLVAMGAQSIGTTRLRALTARLDAKTCREAATTLESLDAEREPWRNILSQEEDWQRHLPFSFRDKLAGIVMSKSLGAAKRKAETRFNENQLELRRLTLQLASRAFELEKGAPPKAVGELIPDYLKTVPQDPVSGTNLGLSP